MKIGFSVILDTTNEEDIQSLARILQVFKEQSNTVKDILISTAQKWDVENAAVQPGVSE